MGMPGKISGGVWMQEKRHPHGAASESRRMEGGQSGSHDWSEDKQA